MCLLLELCEAFIWPAISEVQLTLMNLSSAAEELELALEETNWLKRIKKEKNPQINF